MLAEFLMGVLGEVYKGVAAWSGLQWAVHGVFCGMIVIGVFAVGFLSGGRR